MIAIADIQGSLVRAINHPSGVYGWHRIFGFISESAATDRAKARYRLGLPLRQNLWDCRFEISKKNGSLEVTPIDGCEVEEEGDDTWILKTPRGLFRLTPEVDVFEGRLANSHEQPDATWKGSVLLASLILGSFFLVPQPEIVKEPEPEIIQQVTVRVMPERQRAVRVPAGLAETLPQVAKQIEKGGKGGVAQNLGFLGVLGKKNLKNALGGMPSKLKGATAGAGAGGSQGSGGEMIVGLGQGVKRATVGNSGVAGLGGVGTKGSGGGAGGYGNSMIASGTGGGLGYGNGKGLSTMPLGSEMVLEGGLDRSVIQATIAKYLHQVRACYETGLRSNPGLMGQIAMAFEINGLGKLNYSKVKKSTLGNENVENCISQRMMGWQFPKPMGGVNVKVAYPFLLRPVNS